MLGYMIWDRKTALQPALDKAANADTKSTNLIRSLRKYSKKHPDLAEILRIHGILCYYDIHKIPFPHQPIFAQSASPKSKLKLKFVPSTR